MKRLIFALLVICCSASVFSAQSDQNDPFRGAMIPAGLKPLLIERLRDFVEIQRREEWTRLFDFLSAAQKDPSRPRLTDEQRQCIVEQFKSAPILKFTPEKTLMTTMNFNVPLNKRTWFVEGEAELKTAAGISKRSLHITVRYFNRNWFFSIPNFYYEQWSEKKYAQTDLSVGKKELLKVIEQPGSPVEIIDISVKIRPTSFGLRDYYFKVRNNTGKKIVSYGYRLIEAGQTVGSPNDIAPGESASESGFYPANQVFCEDQERPVRIFITRVKFSDGTKWQSKLKQFMPY